MNKNVVLFLTTPNSPSRIKMSLDNFKQLEKLGFDIITLTTTDLLSDYIYENSKYVIHDYNQHKCYKKDYYEFYKKSNGLGYYFYNINQTHSTIIFQDTNFPSILRNTRTLIHFAESFCYEKYFYVEDDHYFHDDDLEKIHSHFNLLSENDSIFFTFKISDYIDDIAYCSYFHFGDVKKNNLLFKNFAYTRENFLQNKEIYFKFYEKTFYTLINLYKSHDYRIHEISTNLRDIFKKSKLNKVYSNLNLDDDSKCTILVDKKHNSKKFYYTTVNLIKNVNIKFYLENELNLEIDLQPNNWYVLPIEDEIISKLSVVINDGVKKNFSNLELDKVIYNGEFIQ